MLRLLHSNFRLIFLLSGLAFLTSCSQLSSFQTAKVVGKNQATVGGAVIGYGLQDDNVSGGEIGKGIFPHVEVFGRYGVGESIDMGLRLSTSGNLLVDGKFQLVGDQKSRFAMSLGGGLEYQASNPSEVFIFRTHIPLYFSYHPDEKNAIYAVPRYVFQFVSGDNNSNFLGGSTGFSHRFSEKFTGMVEGSLYKPYTQNSSSQGTYIYQVGLGVAFHINR